MALFFVWSCLTAHHHSLPYLVVSTPTCNALVSRMSALNIFLTTWNTGLQGSKAQSQDLTSWLLPVLQQRSQGPEIPQGETPDIYAIGVQELLPLHLACKLSASISVLWVTELMHT